jgi:GTP-binding protein
LIVDSRRGLLAGDEQLLGWAHELGKPIHVLLSKADQLKRAEARSTLTVTRAALSGRASAELFSAHANTGIDQARHTLDEWLLNK